MEVKLLALRFENLGESQTLNGLDEDKGRSAYRFCFAIRNPLYDIFELAKRTLHLDHTSFIIGSHLFEELNRF